MGRNYQLVGMRRLMFPLVIIGAVAAVVVIVLLSGLRIAKEYQRGVLFRLGRYMGLRGPGLYWIIPLGPESKTTTTTAATAPIITRGNIRRLVPITDCSRVWGDNPFGYQRRIREAGLRERLIRRLNLRNIRHGHGQAHDLLGPELRPPTASPDQQPLCQAVGRLLP